MCCSLAGCYNVTPTAIRHIWDRRTWVWTTLPYWTAEDMAASLAEGTCESCKCKAIASNKIEDTCELCPINRKRGRPRGAKARPPSAASAHHVHHPYQDPYAE
jgi:hypothetical protein